MSTLARSSLVVAATAGLCFALPSLALAKVKIAVDLDSQTMHVEAKGQSYDWKVSSGKPGFETPAGTFGVLWMDKDHHSDEYDGAFMPDAIFFAPGYAIHGFGKSPWGHKASHGCIRIPVAKADMLFDLVKAEGAEVSITGYSPVVAPTVASIRQKQQDQAAARDASASYAPDPDAPDAYAPVPYAPGGYAQGRGGPEDAATARQPGVSNSGGLFGSVY